MDWELWTKELDEEVLVEDGEFGSQENCVCVFVFCFCPWIRSAFFGVNCLKMFSFVLFLSIPLTGTRWLNH